MQKGSTKVKKHLNIEYKVCFKHGLEFRATVGIMRAWFYHYWECVKLRDCTQTKDL